MDAFLMISAGKVQQSKFVFFFFVSADGIYGIYPKKAFLSRHRSLKTLLGSHRENLGLGGGFNVFFLKESSPLLGGNDEPNWTWTFFSDGLKPQPPTTN